MALVVFFTPVNNNVGGKVLSYPVWILDSPTDLECAKQASKSHFDTSLLAKKVTKRILMKHPIQYF